MHITPPVEKPVSYKYIDYDQCHYGLKWGQIVEIEPEKDNIIWAEDIDRLIASLIAFNYMKLNESFFSFLVGLSKLHPHMNYVYYLPDNWVESVKKSIKWGEADAGF